MYTCIVCTDRTLDLIIYKIPVSGEGIATVYSLSEVISEQRRKTKMADTIFSLKSHNKSFIHQRQGLHSVDFEICMLQVPVNGEEGIPTYLYFVNKRTR